MHVYPEQGFRPTGVLNRSFRVATVVTAFAVVMAIAKTPKRCAEDGKEIVCKDTCGSYYIVNLLFGVDDLVAVGVVVCLRSLILFLIMNV